MTRALWNVVVALARIPVGAFNSLACKVVGHRRLVDGATYYALCARCGADLPY